MKTTWVTFYSYKGGVGRSMALVNVAAHLAKIGRRVVMIDFDLEAPGLDSFGELEISETEGVVDYIDEFRTTRTTPSIKRFVHKCNIPVHADGGLWLMPSGARRQGYADRLHHIDWNQLYEDKIAQPFISNWKCAIEQTFRPDYVFVDSRTGFTDIGGVCTLHFPDIVVLIFALNHQNLAGIAGVRRTIKEVKGRGPIQVVTVASPVPNLARDSSKQLEDRLADAKRLLDDQPDAVITYFPPVALVERIWTLDESFPPPRIADEYRGLSKTILEHVRDGIDGVVARAEKAIKLSDEISAPGIVEVLRNEYGDRAEALRLVAQLERVRGDKSASMDALERALTIDPSDNDGFVSLVNQYRSAGRHSDIQRLANLISSLIGSDRSERFAANWFEIGQIFMEMREYRKAVEAYQAAIDSDHEQTLVVMFNLAEARRRATGTVAGLDWMTVLNLLTAEAPSDPSSDQPDGLQANHAQALHIAYAVTGNVAAAVESLDKAIGIAEKLHSATRIFSVDTYTWVAPEPFIASTRAMRESLQKGQLWDGMKVSGG